jgi:hypothetical protein
MLLLVVTPQPAGNPNQSLIKKRRFLQKALEEEV